MVAQIFKSAIFEFGRAIDSWFHVIKGKYLPN